jgi:hypothetical protein
MTNDALTSYYNSTPPAITPLPATPHQHDPLMEHLVELRDSHPDDFARLPATTRIALGHYEQTRPE